MTRYTILFLILFLGTRISVQDKTGISNHLQ